MKLSKRGDILPFLAMEVMKAANDRAANGGDVLHLEIGQPSTSAPARVLEAARDALFADALGYTEALGIRPLREAISHHYKTWYDYNLPPDRVAVTTGSSGGFVVAFLAAFDAGDRVALASPCYPAYRNILKALDLEAVILPANAASRFQPTAAMLQALDKPVQGLLIASPSNPAGTMLEAEAMAELAGHCQDQGITIISDEIYHGITYERAAETILHQAPDAIVVNSFSKYFSMTGWRVGWMVLPEPMVAVAERLIQNLFVSAPAISQHAALAAFDADDELQENLARYARNRDILLSGLPAAGIDRLAPADGAFYIYADISRFTNDSEQWCRRLLQDTGVALTPGTDFDRDNGSHFVRFSFAGNEVQMHQAVERIGNWLNKSG